MSRSPWITYDDFGRVSRRISDRGHRLELTGSAAEKRLGLCAVVVASCYGLVVVDYLRESNLDMILEVIFVASLPLVLLPLFWAGAITLWRRIRIDVDAQRIVLRMRGLLPRGQTVIRPLRELVYVSVGSAKYGRRLYFELSTGESLRTPRVWTPDGQLDALLDWIRTAMTEMRTEAAPGLARREDERDDERTVAPVDSASSAGPGMARWPPPPRSVPLRIWLRVLLDARVVLWSFVLMGLGPLAAWDLFGSDALSPLQFAGLRSRTSAVIEACEGSDFKVGGGKYGMARRVRRFSYSFEAGGATWRSVSYIDRPCAPVGERMPVEYPIGFPGTSRLRDMRRHPYGPGTVPLWIALLIYALVELAVVFVDRARELRLLRWGRTTTATLEEVTPLDGCTLLRYRVVVLGRRVRSAYVKYGEPDDGDRAQMVIYDRAEPSRRRFTARMYFENLSAFGRLEATPVAGIVIRALLLGIALLLVARAILWTALHQA
jgi:hypothetical protein